jgi:hypothetical protein
MNLFVSAQGQTIVPNSTSPDGSVALYYEHSSSKPIDEGYKFYFRNPQTLSAFSAQLNPDVPNDLTTASDMDAQSSAILLGAIGSHFEALRHHILWDPALTCEVAWSTNSKWISIEGGAHRFWMALIYHSVDGRFQRVLLPDFRFAVYFDAHMTNLQIPDRGAAAAIRKITPRLRRPKRLLAGKRHRGHFNAYPYLLRDADYEKLARHDLFFVVDAHTNLATITGFCR